MLSPEHVRGRFILSIFLLLSIPGRITRGDAIEQIFTHPPDAARPSVYWFWMGRNITAEGITGDLEALKAAGFGGTTMCNLGDVCTPWPYEIGNGLNPKMIPYVTDDWWKLVRHAAAESHRLGLDFGIHNCPGYESNGGPWITPELSMQELCFSQTPATGGLQLSLKLPKPAVDPRAHMPFPIYNADNGKVEKPEIPGRTTFYRDIAVLALPADGVVPKERVIDLSRQLAPDGSLQWDAPPGKWIVYRFGHTTMGSLIQPTIWKSTGLECDKMNPQAVTFHMDHVTSLIKQHLGDLVGNGLNYVWFDSYEAGTPSWTPAMREEFQARRGYDLTAFLPTRANRVIGSPDESRKFAADFHRTIQDLYRDVNFKISSQKAHDAGLKIESEPYGGPWVVSEIVPSFDEVAGEFWNRGGKYGPYAVADVVAGTHLAGRNVINAEAFTAGPDVSLWDETPGWIKPIGDAAYCDGVNRLMLHRFTHDPFNGRYKPGVVMGQWGTHFDRTQTWWEPGKAWVQYMQRCQAMLQWGKIADSPNDVKIRARGNAKIHSVHRTDGTAHVFFLANLARTRGAAQCAFPLAGMQPELWDPVTGTLRDLKSFEISEGRTTLPLRFDVSQSAFVVFRRAIAADPAAANLKNFPRRTASLELSGSWEVTFDPKWGGPAKPVLFDTLTDWTTHADRGIKYFSGTAVYRKTFDAGAAKLSSTFQLDLGAVNHLARVKLNGRDLGVAWCAPWSASIPPGLLKPTQNQLEIEITNVWANRLIGDEQEPADCEWLPGHHGHGGFLKAFPDWVIRNQPRPSQGRYCFTTWNYFTSQSHLTPSGLLGPVRLMEEDWTREPEDDFPAPTSEPGKDIAPKASPVAILTWQDRDSAAAFESDVLKQGLLPISTLIEEHPAHEGGGGTADVLRNGTTLNGKGEPETENDGKTFRGYAKGSVLTFRLDTRKSEPGYDLREVRSFAGHNDSRASQNYSVLVATATDPERFTKLTDVALKSGGQSSEVRVRSRTAGPLATGIAAVRLEFHDGPEGFNVYREIQLVGAVHAMNNNSR